jgi:hypothetical protein
MPFLREEDNNPGSGNSFDMNNSGFFGQTLKP